MFCKKCGSQLADGTVFCSNCGMRQDDNAVAIQQGAVSEKEVVLSEMNNSFAVMTAIKEKEFAIAEHTESIEKEYEKSKKRYVVLIWFIGIILSSAFSAFGNFVSVLTIIAFGVIGVFYRKKHKKKSETLLSEKSNYEQELEILKNDAVLYWLPYDYRDSESFAYLFSYINNMRASSLKEAINLYETEKHHTRLELISAITAQSAANAADAANSAAASAAASAFFSLFK
ncbi:MAG: zinc ribbon domain-containing protein [Ruminococcus sp.]|nr:zinc ribbon domain-containing protein [Ruminococcus sp.]